MYNQQDLHHNKINVLMTKRLSHDSSFTQRRRRVYKRYNPQNIQLSLKINSGEETEPGIFM